GSLGGERRVLAGGVVRPTARKGAIGVDVVIEGDRLVAGFPTSLWIRTSPPTGGLLVTVDPEPGLLAEPATTRTCASGWAELPVTAQAHVVGAGVKVARAGSGPADEGESGTWFGALPVAPGAFFIRVPRVLPAGTPASVVLVAPNPRDVVYAELDDVRGRVVAAALPVTVVAGDPTPRATFALPALSPGLYWVVASGEPRGAEHLSGAAVARAVWVGDDAPGISVHDACSIGPYLAQRPAAGVTRWVALDGLPARSAANRVRHTWGLVIGTVSLTLAGVLVTLLMAASAREARVAMQLAELDDDASAQKVTATPPGGSAAVGILVALLGLALLAVLLIAKG
ncbi:MAG: hypothetical protein JWP97_2705, partial [Labilithrix sp.]|nr:hypothetical protein [Labilithrix sp.]